MDFRKFKLHRDRVMRSIIVIYVTKRTINQKPATEPVLNEGKDTSIAGGIGNWSNWKVI